MSDSEFNPNSNDSMFSQILERLGTQDVTLKEILIQTKATNGRVTKLERERSFILGIVRAFLWLGGACVAGVALIQGVKEIIK